MKTVIGIAAVITALVSFGTYNAYQIDRVCGATRNPALCELLLDAGKSEALARAAGDRK